MVKRVLSILGTVCLYSMVSWAQADSTILLPQYHFKATVPAGNYSGIAWLGGSRYAVVDDKSPYAGFHLMTIEVDSLTGLLLDIRHEGFMTDSLPNRDEEGVCYVPQWNTLFVSGEADGQILEYNLQGQQTGRRLDIPEVFATAYSNSGFEALTYNAVTHRFWTTSENTLRADGIKPSLANRVGNRLRLQSFGDDLQPFRQYWYETDAPLAASDAGSDYLGVCGLAALDDGRIVVLEREVYTSPKKLGSFVHVKLYVASPSSHQSGDLLEKRLLTEFRTKINLTARSFANYEGLCLGPRLADGSQLLLLLSDSQNQYKGILKDWFRTVVIK